MTSQRSLPRMLDALEAIYGHPEPAKVTDPLEMILRENVAYLVSDERREAAFKALKERVGTAPEKILAASPAVLRDVAALGGMLPDQRMGKLLAIADIALTEFRGDLRAILKRPLAEAKKALKKFPSIGDPGAEKILLFSGSHQALALDSNGLRVLRRLGFGEEKTSYAATYRAVQAAVKPQLKEDTRWLIRAHELLRRHGQELCRRSQPRCGACPLTRECAYSKSASDGRLEVRSDHR